MSFVICKLIEVNKHVIEFHFSITASPVSDDIIMQDMIIYESDNAALLNIISSFQHKYSFYRYGLTFDRVNRITDYKGVWSLVGISNRDGYSSFYDINNERIYFGVLEKDNLIFSRFSPLSICSDDFLDINEIGCLLSQKERLLLNEDTFFKILEEKHKGICVISINSFSDDFSQIVLRVRLDVIGFERINKLLDLIRT